MKYLTHTIVIVLFSILAGCDWYHWNPPPSGDATLQIHVTTNIGGPMIGPLEGAPIHILAPDGSVRANGLTDKNGDLHFTLTAGSYIVDPQEVPKHEDFYTPPEQQKLTLKAGETRTLDLHYDNPIL